MKLNLALYLCLPLTLSLSLSIFLLYLSLSLSLSLSLFLSISPSLFLSLSISPSLFLSLSLSTFSLKVNAMEVSGIEGNYRLTCEKVLHHSLSYLILYYLYIITIPKGKKGNRAKCVR